ncbi:MAG: sensor histidine kinase [Burkholderiaceae bacterium]|nr:MAG: sensor histidine kinase [Burkholderiaceae bacterium]
MRELPDPFPLNAPLADPPDEAPGRPMDWLMGLTFGRVLWALLAGLAVAVVLNPIFGSPFPILLARVWIVAMVGLLTFQITSRWPARWRPAWLPSWVLQLVSMVVVVPAASLFAAVLSAGGTWEAFAGDSMRIIGFVFVAEACLMVGLVILLTVMVREREARARQQALHHALERSEWERRNADAQLKLLQAQIEPHFLFNTLANIQQLVATGAPQAPAVLGSLVNYLRAAMPDLKGQGSTLGREFELARAYLELMHLRMPDRMQFSLQLTDELRGLHFPPAGLLTLVENAVQHGIDPCEEGGLIEVTATWQGDGIVLQVRDTGQGLVTGQEPGVGLANLVERMRLLHPGSSFQLQAGPGRGALACLRIPVPESDHVHPGHGPFAP